MLGILELNGSVGLPQGHSALWAYGDYRKWYTARYITVHQRALRGMQDESPVPDFGTGLRFVRVLL